jgi:hypothetical protein
MNCTWHVAADTDTTSTTGCGPNMNSVASLVRTPHKDAQEFFVRLSIAVWLIAAVGIASVLGIVRALRRKTSARRLDVGSVSDQWMAEHRVGFGERR